MSVNIVSISSLLYKCLIDQEEKVFINSFLLQFLNNIKLFFSNKFFNLELKETLEYF